MKVFVYNFISTVFLFALFAITATSIQAQTTLAVQDFEVVPATPTWAITAGSGNISTLTGSGDTPASQRIRGGTRSWQVIGGATATLDLATYNFVAGYQSVKVTVRISSTSTNGTNGADPTDTLRVFANLNGAGFPGTADITVAGASAGGGTGDARWGYNNTVNATTPAGTPLSVSGTAGTNAGTIYSTLEITIPNGTNSIALRIVALNDAIQEIWSVDDITLTGTLVTASSVSVGGRVSSFDGNAISRARVSMVDSSGAVRTALTNQFGYYRFTGVPSGAIYVLSVRSKLYEFGQPTQVVNASEDVSDINFIALPSVFDFVPTSRLFSRKE